MPASHAHPKQTVRTQRLAGPAACADQAAKPKKTAATAVEDLFGDGFGPHRLMVAYLDEHGDIHVVRGLAREVLVLDSRRMLLFDDGLQVPLDSLTAVGMTLAPI